MWMAGWFPTNPRTFLRNVFRGSLSEQQSRVGFNKKKCSKKSTTINLQNKSWLADVIIL
jgi:hypothetical protein